MNNEDWVITDVEQWFRDIQPMAQNMANRIIRESGDNEYGDLFQKYVSLFYGINTLADEDIPVDVVITMINQRLKLLRDTIIFDSLKY